MKLFAKTFGDSPLLLYTFLLRGLANIDCELKQIYLRQAFFEILIFCHYK